MFSINEYVVYGTIGICEIVDIRKEKFSGCLEKEYYLLKPVYSNSSTVYVPIDNENLTKKMRSILTVNEIYDLIKTMPHEKSIWIEDYRLRNEKYNEIISKGDRQELIMLIKTLYFHKIEQEKSKKKFFATDERIMAAAEKLLYEEFALVLDIKPKEVIPFIIEHIPH